MEQKISLSVIIVNWNVKQFLKECLESIKKNIKNVNYEIIVVDNNSNDNSVDMLKCFFPEVILIQNKTNLGFAKANNHAIKISVGNYILLLNPDTVVLSDLAEQMLAFMEAAKDVGVCGCRLISPQNPDAPFNVGWLKFPSLKHEMYSDTFLERIVSKMQKKNTEKIIKLEMSKPVETDWVSGACLMIRKKTVEQVGLMDENIFLYAEDVEWCYRIKKEYGWKLYVLPYVEVIHYGQQSMKKDKNINWLIHYYHGRYRFFQKYANKYLFLCVRIIKTILFFVEYVRNVICLMISADKEKYIKKLQIYNGLIKIVLGVDFV